MGTERVGFTGMLIDKAVHITPVYFALDNFSFDP
jgi:hypothetical protein